MGALLAFRRTLLDSYHACQLRTTRPPQVEAGDRDGLGCSTGQRCCTRLTLIPDRECTLSPQNPIPGLTRHSTTKVRFMNWQGELYLPGDMSAPSPKVA
jgi:hypothetical protein